MGGFGSSCMSTMSFVVEQGHQRPGIIQETSGLVSRNVNMPNSLKKDQLPQRQARVCSDKSPIAIHLKFLPPRLTLLGSSTSNYPE